MSGARQPRPAGDFFEGEEGRPGALERLARLGADARVRGGEQRDQPVRPSYPFEENLRGGCFGRTERNDDGDREGGQSRSPVQRPEWALA